jgi:hypothetical protein
MSKQSQTTFASGRCAISTVTENQIIPIRVPDPLMTNERSAALFAVRRLLPSAG